MTRTLNQYDLPEGKLNNAKRLRERCEQSSVDNPGHAVMGANLFGRFPVVILTDRPNQKFDADDLRLTEFGGYWRDGRFQLFSATELAAINCDDDVDDDEGCPVGDPDCYGPTDGCHDACEAPAERMLQ